MSILKSFYTFTVENHKLNTSKPKVKQHGRPLVNLHELASHNFLIEVPSLKKP